MVRDESGINENKIESLTALRGIAFIGIFFLHTGFCIQWATLGVSTFFILSGFLLSYKYFYSNVFGGGVLGKYKVLSKKNFKELSVACYHYAGSSFHGTNILPRKRCLNRKFI